MDDAKLIASFINALGNILGGNKTAPRDSFAHQDVVIFKKIYGQDNVEGVERVRPIFTPRKV
jgi:hypothetical protein